MSRAYLRSQTPPSPALCPSQSTKFARHRRTYHLSRPSRFFATFRAIELDRPVGRMLGADAHRRGTGAVPLPQPQAVRAGAPPQIQRARAVMCPLLCPVALGCRFWARRGARRAGRGDILEDRRGDSERVARGYVTGSN